MQEIKEGAKQTNTEPCRQTKLVCQQAKFAVDRLTEEALSREFQLYSLSTVTSQLSTDLCVLVCLFLSKIQFLIMVRIPICFVFLFNQVSYLDQYSSFIAYARPLYLCFWIQVLIQVLIINKIEFLFSIAHEFELFIFCS